MGLRHALPQDVCEDGPGPLNQICDVPGVRVGHVTLDKGDVHTGVTALLPARQSPWYQKLPAAAHVINGYGKTTGLMQVAELGCLETPVVFTNTLGVGAAHAGLTRHMLAGHPEIGLDGYGTVNPFVTECNDGWLSDIRAMALSEDDTLAALAQAEAMPQTGFAEGAVGAGRGMVCYGLKGGIGSASRVLSYAHGSYTLGCLALTNYGSMKDLTLGGEKLGPALAAAVAAQSGQPKPRQEEGSVIVALATDAPFTARQLGRLCRRVQVGLCRTGTFTAEGSGEVALAFSTANRLPFNAKDQPLQAHHLPEDVMDRFFRAVVSCVEEAVLSSMLHAETVQGRAGHTAYSLRQALGLAGKKAAWLSLP